MSLSRPHLNHLRQAFRHYAEVRRMIIEESNRALHGAKRAIFALHRDDSTEAEQKLHDAEHLLAALQKRYKKEYQRMQGEGAYQAGIEEFVEASLFFQWITTRKIGAVVSIQVEGEQYLAGLCDVPGELYRYAIAAATKRDFATVRECAKAANDIIGALIEFDLTSYLRTKFDQAKQANHRLEQVVYEVSLREIRNEK